MASPRWDFRELLDVCPDSYSFTCVGRTKKGTRCGNKRPFLAAADLSNAASILDQMDCLPSLKSSYKHLDELAGLSLCERWHRGTQTQQVVMRWETTIKAYAGELRLAEKRAALENVRKELAAIRENTSKVKVKAKVMEDNKENIVPVTTTKTTKVEFVPPPKSVHRSTAARFTCSNLEDPFTGSAGSNCAKPNISVTTTFGTGAFDSKGFDNSAFKYVVPERALKAAPSESVLPSSGTALPIPKLDVVTSKFSTNNPTSRHLSYTVREVDSPTLPTQDIQLPSPPITPLRSRSVEVEVKESKEQKEPTSPLTKVEAPNNTGSYNVKADVKMSKPVASKRTNFALEFGSQSSKPTNVFVFELPAEVNILEETETKSQPLQMDGKSTPSTIRFSLSPTSSMRVHMPAVPRKSSRRQRVPRLNTSLGAPKAAPVDVTRSFVTPYIPASSKHPTDIVSSATTRCTSTPINQTTDASPHRVSPVTPVNKHTGPGITLAPTPNPQSPSPMSLTPPQEARRSFGYAVVTPSPIRYSTYLPARQRYGLVTPPETPENLPPHPSRRAPTIPSLPLVKDEDFFTAISSPTTVFSIPRKPLPPRSSTSLMRRNEVRWRSVNRVRTCQVCMMPQHVDDSDVMTCSCRNAKEEVVKSGCLDKLGWAKLREKVIDRMRSKASEGGALETGSPKKKGNWRRIG